MPEKEGLVGRLTSAFRRKQKVDLIVGLDFGTSSTKVAFRELGSQARRIVPITFNHGLQAYPTYCLPSVGFLTPDRRLIWGPDAVRRLEKSSWSSGIRRLKVLVAGEQNPAFRDSQAVQEYNRYLEAVGLDPSTHRPEHLAAVAVAMQMQRVREVLQERYSGADLDIRFNVCVPIDHMEHAGMLCVQNKINHVAEDIYRTWTADGWEPSELVEVAAAKFDDASPDSSPDDRLFAMPEAMAQIASYLDSLETEQGIHAVIDIGSGTTDLSIFSLMGPSVHERGGYWYAARNVPRGTGYVEAAVASRLEAKAGGSRVVTESDVVHAMESAKVSSDIGMAINHQLILIWDALRATWTEGYARHYKQQTAWEKIPVFLCGGGSRLVGGRDIFRKAWVPNFDDFHVRKLPIPEDFDDHRGTIPFDRLSVAYGLTFLAPELGGGGFILPKDSPDHTPRLFIRDLPLPQGDGEPG